MLSQICRQSGQTRLRTRLKALIYLADLIVNELTSTPAQEMRIPARSRNQAMDWSLVLVSQGIETIIDHDQNELGWGLLVHDQDYQRAIDVIRLYRQENRRWLWQRNVFRPGLLFDWASLAWVALTVIFFGIDTQNALQAAGLMDTAALARGQWWRLFTAIWLHGDIAHLASNCVFGLILLGLVMARFGTGIGLLASYLAGAGGNAIAWALSSQPTSSLGASGMVMGSLGLLALSWLSHRPRIAPRYVAAGICAGLMLFVLLGLSPGTYIQAHAGGFLSGLILGVFLLIFPIPPRQPAANLLSGILFCIFVLVPWWLALGR
jgi:membrane associated rhomboid family serine protease